MSTIRMTRAIIPLQAVSLAGIKVTGFNDVDARSGKIHAESTTLDGHPVEVFIRWGMGPKLTIGVMTSRLIDAEPIATFAVTITDGGDVVATDPLATAATKMSRS